MIRTLAVSLAAILFVGCGGGGKPTQEQLGKQLTELASALEAGDVDKAAPHLMVPPGRSLDELKPQLPKILERKEISSDGVKILLEKGKFGKLADIFPEHGGKRAERAGVKLDECYGLRLDPGEVMAHWDGGKFKIFRLDDIGKLTADTPAPAADEAKPAADEAKPAADEAKPAADEAKPAADEAKPAADAPADAPAADAPAAPAPAADAPAPAADAPAAPAPAADAPAPAADEAKPEGE